jgi:hypothetical protein
MFPAKQQEVNDEAFAFAPSLTQMAIRSAHGHSCHITTEENNSQHRQPSGHQVPGRSPFGVSTTEYDDNNYIRCLQGPERVKQQPSVF